MRRFPILALLLLLAATGAAQLRITSVRPLPLDPARSWAVPKFSPDGSRVYFSDAGFDGIWEYTLTGGSIREITRDPASGYGFAISPDGKRLAYRRTYQDAGALERRQEVVILNLSDLSSTVAGRGEDLSTPAFSGGALFFTKDAALQSAGNGAAGPVLLGIENTRIALVRGASKSLLDPFGGGSYVWPSLSPDGASLLAFETSRGAFVSDLGGNVRSLLGRRDAPVWTRDGRWVVFMETQDDGERITASELVCIRPDGTGLTRLTATPDSIELYPECSPRGNLIVCQTAAGALLLLTYEEEGR
jgi:Tol biopolymer transport system component